MIKIYLEDISTIDSEAKFNAYFDKLPKYRQEKIFPSFTWENFSFSTKSFIIELIEDDIHKKWQVINIPR